MQLFDIVEIVGLIPKLADDILKNYPTEFIEKLQNSVTDHPRKLSLNPAPKINLKKECELLGIERKKQIAETVQNIECIFRKNRALAPHERSAVPLGTDHCPVG